MRFAAGHHVVVRLGLLQHQVHRPDVVLGVSPIAPCFEIPEPKFRRHPQLDLGDRATNLARHKLITAARSFMIEENAAGSKTCRKLRDSSASSRSRQLC